jgi:hypothetical protein
MTRGLVTNKFLQSSAMTASPWAAPQNLTPTAGQADPFGGTEATLWTETVDGGATSHLMQQVPQSTPIGTWLIASVYFKTGVRTCIGIAPNGGGNSACFNPTTGVVTGTNGSLLVQGIFGGVEVCREDPTYSRAWLLYRTTNTSEVRFYVANVGTSLTYQGNGSAALTTYGAMVEVAQPSQTTPSLYVASGATAGTGKRDYRQNWLAYSDNLTKWGVQIGSATITAGNISAASGANFLLRQTGPLGVGANSGVQFTFEIDLMADVACNLTITMADATDGSPTTNVVCALTTSWQRFKVTQSTTSPGAGSIGCYLGDGSAGFPVGRVISARRAQLSQSSTVQSFISTNGAPANSNGAPRSIAQ